MGLHPHHPDPDHLDPDHVDPDHLDPVHPDPVHLYGLDIETDTSVDGLDPAHAAVVAVGLCTPSGDEVLLGEEAELLDRLERRLTGLEPGVLITWNGRGFDLPFLAERARVHGVALSLELWRDQPEHGLPRGSHADTPFWPPPDGGFGGRWGAHPHLDGYRTYRADVRRCLGVSCGLKAMARLVGLPLIEVDRSALHTLDDATVAAYVASDARLARALVARRLPAVLAATDRRPERPDAPAAAPAAGSSSPVRTL